MKKPILESFTMNGRCHQIKEGDYILYNGACYQFCTGDNRTLRSVGHDHYDYLKLTKKVISVIPFTHLIRKDCIECGMAITKWFF